MALSSHLDVTKSHSNVRPDITHLNTGNTFTDKKQVFNGR